MFGRYIIMNLFCSVSSSIIICGADADAATALSDYEGNSLQQHHLCCCWLDADAASALASTTQRSCWQKWLPTDMNQLAILLQLQLDGYVTIVCYYIHSTSPGSHWIQKNAIYDGCSTVG